MSSKLSQQKVINYLTEKYSNYNFKDFIYNGYDIKSTVYCNIHGKFYKSYGKLKVSGCKSCNIMKRANSQRWDKNKFLIEANKVHNYKYRYKNAEYTSNSIKLDINCIKHGIFEQTPNKHLQGRGCPKCSMENNGYKFNSWAKRVTKTNKATLYVIKCYNDNEKFIKVGITSNSVKIRFNSKSKMPYKFHILHTIVSSNSKYIWDLEIHIKRKLINYKYSPNIHFKGKGECFSVESIKYLNYLI